MDTFQITDDQLTMQLADITATTEDGDHLVQMDYSILILSSEGPRSAQQASAYLTEGEWSELTYSTCGLADCVRPDHTTTSQSKAQAVKDEELLTLVQQSSVSLADLYRKAKSRGLMSPARDY